MYSRFGRTLGGGLGYMRGTSAAGPVGVSNGAFIEVLAMAFLYRFRLTCLSLLTLSYVRMIGLFFRKDALSFRMGVLNY